MESDRVVRCAVIRRRLASSRSATSVLPGRTAEKEQVLNSEQNTAGTRMTCTNSDCGCELQIVTPCPHGSNYACACGHSLEAVSSD